MTDADRVVLADHLRRDEGRRLLPYRDGVGALTIGYGHRLTVDGGITPAVAELLLQYDIDTHQAELWAAVPLVASLDPVRQLVLIEMAFNLGVPKLLGFVQMWARIRRQDYPGAAEAMLDSRWARQVGARATRLASAMASGEFPIP
jgi:lysozyme